MRVLIACMLVLASTFVFARDLPAPRGVQVAITVDATGHVSSAKVVDDLPKATVARIVERVSAFEFTPASRAGHAAECSTTLWLEFAFEPVDDENVAIRIRDAYTAPGLVPRKRNNPGYPSEMLRKRLDSDVRLELAYDTEGKVTGTTVLESTGHPSFGEAAAKMVSRWQLVPERVAGVGVPGTVVVPIAFRIADGRKHAEPPASRMMETTDAAEPRALVADSEVALRTAVAGTLL